MIVKDPDLGTDDAKKAERLRDDIVETRNHMARTVDAIEERLSPKNIKAQVSSVKNHLLEEVSSTKTKLLEEIKDVKSTVKTEVSSELVAAKDKVREATVGRVENMVNGARESVSNAGSTTIDTVKTNPIPAAMIAVGLGWLIASSLKSRKTSSVDTRIQARSFDGVDQDGYAYSYDRDVAARNFGTYEGVEPRRSGGPRRMMERGRRVASNVRHDVSNAASNLGENVSSMGHDVADKVSGVANTVAEKAEHIAHDASSMAQGASRRAGMVARNAGMQGRRVVRRAGTQARRMEQGFERELKANPIPFGAIALVAGAAIGLLLPHTEVEDRLIGEKKDRLLDEARERMEGVAKQAISTVQDKAGELTQNLQGEKGGDSKGASSQSQPYSNGLSGSHANGLSNGLSKHV